MQPPQLALGVLSAPAAHARRHAARGSWLQDPAVIDGRVAVRFVLGYMLSTDGHGGPQTAEHAACRALCVAARDSSSDTVLVDAPDCKMWHSPAKVHAWFKHALQAFPATPWIGKTEEDAMLWPTALVVDLASLPSGVLYYGIMGWQGSCRSGAASAAAVAANAAAAQRALDAGVAHGSGASAAPVECSGCYGHPVSDGIGLCRSATCRAAGPGSPINRRCCQVGCPKSVRMAPFAVGALDVRSRALASDVARCAYADYYFALISRVSSARGIMCTTTDGAQGHAIGECHAPMSSPQGMLMADAGRSRLTDGVACRRRPAAARATGGGGLGYGTGRTCGDGLAQIVHPLKLSNALAWNETWLALTRHSAPGIASASAGGALPLVSFAVSSRGDARPPMLRLEAEINGLAGANGKSIGVAWGTREEQTRKVVRWHTAWVYNKTGQSRTRGDGSGAGEGGALARQAALMARQSGGARLRVQRRRLREAPLWSLNCSRFWASARD